MDLKVKDVADLLNVSETTVRRWINDKKIPTYQLGKHYYFSRTEIENWVMSHKLDTTNGQSPFSKQTLKSDEMPSSTLLRSGNKQYSLFRALSKGIVCDHIIGMTKEDVIRNTMKSVSKSLNFDADVMTDLLLDRENLMPTALNNGIAVPHTRDSLSNTHYDSIITVFLDKPLEYGALDGKPVHTLFFLFACEDKRHLHLLAKIAHLSSHLPALEFFQTRPSREKLLSFVKEWESQIPRSAL